MLQFMLGHMRVAAGGSLSTARETTFRSGALNVRVRELLGAYMSLEEVYMGECAAMAIRIDEVGGVPPLKAASRSWGSVPPVCQCW